MQSRGTGFFIRTQGFGTELFKGTAGPPAAPLMLAPGRPARPPRIKSCCNYSNLIESIHRSRLWSLSLSCSLLVRAGVPAGCWGRDTGCAGALRREGAPRIDCVLREALAAGWIKLPQAGALA